MYFIHVSRTHTRTLVRGANVRTYVVHKYVQFMRSLVTLKCGQATAHWSQCSRPNQQTNRPTNQPTDRPSDRPAQAFLGCVPPRSSTPASVTPRRRNRCHGLNLYIIFIRRTHARTGEEERSTDRPSDRPFLGCTTLEHNRCHGLHLFIY